MLAAATIAALVAVTAGAVYLGAAVAARHRAQAAADLSALAAAGELASGRDIACGRAGAVATAMDTVLTHCDAVELDVVVAVEATVPIGRLTVGPARAVARAGPVTDG
ncbi:Rv3654c family TadE-like protein [Mycolicibacterium phlei]